MDLDEEKVGLVLVRASELRSKIADCIQTRTKTNPGQDPNEYPSSSSMEPQQDDDDDATDEESDALLTICDAFDSLESLLHSFQTLVQQQQYEREAVIGDLENSRKMLLKKLSEYKGEHVDVIREAEVFAGMKVEHDHDILHPPYPTRIPNSIASDSDNLSRFTYTRKRSQNGYNGSDLNKESRHSKTSSSSIKLWGGLKFLIQSTAKTMITLVGVISLLNLAGFEPKIGKRGASLNVLTLLQQSDTANKKLIQQCPPGKVAVMEDGKIHCVVKERVEIPFYSVAENPDVNYGCG